MLKELSPVERKHAGKNPVRQADPGELLRSPNIPTRPLETRPHPNPRPQTPTRPIGVLANGIISTFPQHGYRQMIERMLDFPLFVHRVPEVLSDGRARQVADALFAGKWCDQSIIAAGDVLGRVNALQKKGGKKTLHVDSSSVRFMTKALSYVQRSTYRLERHTGEGRSGVLRPVARAARVFVVRGLWRVCLAGFVVVRGRVFGTRFNATKVPVRAPYVASARYGLNPETCVSEVEGRVLLTRGESVLLLNRTGSNIAKLLGNRPMSDREVFTSLATRCRLPESAHADIADWLQDLLSLEFLQPERNLDQADVTRPTRERKERKPYGENPEFV